MYGVKEETKPTDREKTFLYRKEKKLTTAIIISHLLAYLDGHMLPGYVEFLDRYNLRDDPNVIRKLP